jgi:hypothetical protein
MGDTIRYEGDERPFYDETSFVAGILGNWPQASDADIDAVKRYAKSINDLVTSETFAKMSEESGTGTDPFLLGLAFMVGLAGSTYNGLSAVMQAAIRQGGLG